MKTIKQHLKMVALFLSALMLFQGCTVYKSANVTLEEAVIANTKVRIKMNDNETFRFKSILHEAGIYYGLNYYENARVKNAIDKENIDKVQVKNKDLSTIISVGIPLILIGLVVWGAVADWTFGYY